MLRNLLKVLKKLELSKPVVYCEIGLWFEYNMVYSLSSYLIKNYVNQKSVHGYLYLRKLTSISSKCFDGGLYGFQISRRSLSLERSYLRQTDDKACLCLYPRIMNL